MGLGVVHLHLHQGPPVTVHPMVVLAPAWVGLLGQGTGRWVVLRFVMTPLPPPAADAR
jgi:hypothetical protein